MSHDILWFRFYQLVVLYVFLGLDFGMRKCFFENFKIYLSVFISVYSKQYLIITMAL